MAVCMEFGWAASAGNSRSRAASTARRSSSKKGGRFIVAGNWRALGCREASRFALPLWVERLGSQLTIGLLEEDFHAPFRFFQLLLALAGEGDALFKEFHSVVERELRAFETAHNFLETCKRTFKIRFFPSSGFLGTGEF